MTDVLVLSGITGRDDQWHDFDATSAAVADVLRESGWCVEVVHAADARPAQIAAARVVVVNCGVATQLGADGPQASAIADLLAGDVPVLALHITALALHGVSQWVDRLGVRWIEGVSMHPPIGPIAVVAEASHPIGSGLGAVETYDELYTHLDVTRPGAVVLAHELDGVTHPLVIAREDPNGRRTVYDALGHGVDSYRSPSRCDLLRREVDWLLRQDRGISPGRLR